MSGSKHKSRLQRQPLSITSSHISESSSFTGRTKSANERQGRQFSSFTPSTAFVPTKPNTRIDRNLSMDSLDFVDNAPSPRVTDQIPKNSFPIEPDGQEVCGTSDGFRGHKQKQRQHLFSTRPSTTFGKSTSIGAIGCTSSSNSLSSTNSNQILEDEDFRQASTSSIKSHQPYTSQGMQSGSTGRHVAHGRKHQINKKAPSSKMLLKSGTISRGLDPSDIEDIEIVDAKNTSFKNITVDQMRRETALSPTSPLSILNVDGVSHISAEDTADKAVESAFAQPISASIKASPPNPIRKQASIKSTRFSKRFQTRWSVENQSDGSVVNDGKSGRREPVNVSNSSALKPFQVELVKDESSGNSNRLESTQIADGLDAPSQSVLLNKNENNIVVTESEPIVDKKQSFRRLAFSEERQLRLSPTLEPPSNAAVKSDNQHPISGNHSVIRVNNESVNAPSTGIERIAAPPSDRNTTKNHNLENGVLALDNSNGVSHLPSNISLITQICSKFRRRNRVNTMQQDLVAIDVTPEANAKDENVGKIRSCWRKIIFDTSENYFYYWLAVISTAYVYNLLVVVARTVFIEMSDGYLWVLWLSLDLFADSIYFVDMFIRSRTGFLEQGLLIRDGKKIFALYFRSKDFKIDLASIFPLDHVIFALSRQKVPFLRFNRLLRRERIQKFMEQTETRSSLPNAFRVGVVVWYIAIIIHWNACFYFFISERIGLGSDGWVYGWKNEQSLPQGIADTLTRRYIYSFYWSTLILTTIGEVPAPQMNVEYAFVTIDLMCGVLIFATIVGNVGSMISNMSAARTEFQNRIDNIKQYMELRKVGKQLEVRVIKWFDYLWANKQNLADQQVLKVLPDKLQAEIAMHVHFETLRKVRIFQDCEAGLLAELVLKLQLQVFSPMDYVCRKGDIGREMYIVKRGMIQVVSDDGNKVFATLSEGAVFGELSILNIAGSKNGNRRTANVRSVGYTDLFVLNKTDLWIALREYPEARKILIQKGRELLRKDNLLDESAPEENKTAEEIGDELQSSVRILQTRIARLTAEHTNTETKLRYRIHDLERKLGRYGVILKRACSASDDDAGDSGEG